MPSVRGEKNWPPWSGGTTRLVRTHGWADGRRRNATATSRRLPQATWEPRQRWPSGSSCAAPQAKVRDEPGVRLELMVEHYQGRNHLPIVTLNRVA